VVIRVRDTGSGMSPELVSKVFDLFRQGERTLDRSEGGLGIGLTMVKRLVELHGGQVEAFSEGIGKGSEFAIRLPSLTQEQWDEESTGAKDLDPDKRLRVLIVEDSRDVAEMLAVLVSLWGHEVETVYDGSSALEVFGRYQPNAVLCDLGLPGMDGYDVARHLRSSSGALQPLLVAVTGYGGEDEKTRSREAGFDVHMTKPVDPEALETLLAHHNRA